jgi:hypothetical protein
MFGPSAPESYHVHTPSVPMKVQAAIRVIEISVADAKSEIPRVRSEPEGKMLEAAYMVLRYYFTGEMEYADEPRFIALPAAAKPTKKSKAKVSA